MRTLDTYEQYKNIIYDVAWYYNEVTGVDFDELLSLGNTLYMKALGKWSGNKSKFSYYLRMVLTNQMRRYINRKKPQHIAATHAQTMKATTHLTPETHCAFWDMIDNLSDEAKEIVTILYTGPMEILDIVSDDKPKHIRGAIVKHLREEMNWSFNKIWDAFAELRAGLYSVRRRKT